MTISVRGSRPFPAGMISLVGVAKRERWTFPVSLRQLCAPEITKPFPDWSISAGDVTANGQFVITSRGAWSASATVSEGGSVAGDWYVLDLTLNGTPGIGTSFKQKLDLHQVVTPSASGSDPFVRDHFSELNALTAHLHVAPNIGQGISNVLGTLLGFNPDYPTVSGLPGGGGSGGDDPGDEGDGG